MTDPRSDFVERAAWTVGPYVAGWLLVHVPALNDLIDDTQLAAVVAGAIIWLGTYVLRRWATWLPSPGEGLVRQRPSGDEGTVTRRREANRP